MMATVAISHPTAPRAPGRTVGIGLGLVATWVITTFATFRVRDVNDLLGGEAVDGQVAFQVASWGVLGLLAAALMLSGRTDYALLRRGPVAWYLGFSLLALLSSLFSVSPAFTLYYAYQNVVVVLLVCSMGRRLDAVYALIVYYVAINWALLVLGELGLTFGFDWITTAETSYLRYGGSPGEMWRFSTAFGHPSLLSIVAAIGAVGIAAGRAPLRFRRLVVLGLAVTVLLTLSRTAIAGMAAGFVVVAYRRQMIGLATAAVLLGLAVVACMPGLGDDLTALLMRGQSGEEFTSLTGRSEIYSVAMQRAGESWLGDGFRSLRGRPLLGEQWGQGVTHAHNLVLQAQIDLGFAGALAVMATVGSLCAYALRLAWPRRGQGRIARPDHETLAILFPVLAFCTLDSGFAVNVNVFVIVFVMVCARARKKMLTARAAGLRRPPSFASPKERTKWLR